MVKKGYVIPHTHWDREWRYPLWASRMNLADMMDELIEILETQPGYKCFLLDGQFVPIEDYLFSRPEKEEQLKKLVAERRILIGPWYTLPDLYPVSSESIVRNLLEGRQKCLAFGAQPLTVGYESFGWGQPSQFPQIYKGFGIDTVIVAKKVDNSRAPNCEFAWVGKDGTTVHATRLGTEARGNFFMHSYLQIMTGQEYKSDEFCFDGKAGDMIYHQTDAPTYEQDYMKLTNSQYIHEDNLREIALQSWHAMDDTLMDADRAMMDGSDNTSAQPYLLEVVQKINRALEQDGIVMELSSIEDYAALLKEKLPLDSLHKVYGELRDGPPMAITGNALMTRPRIKTLNRQVQAMLFDIAEPLSVVAELLGGKYEGIYLQEALKYLLLAHSHDCINGVTQDKTVGDVFYRLNQALEIAQAVTQRGIRELLKNIDQKEFTPGDTMLLAVNTLPYGRSEVVEACIDLPRELDIWDFDVVDMQGNSMNMQRISRDERTIPTVSLHSRPQPFYVDRHMVQFETGELPAGGYRVYKVVPKSTLARKIEAWAPNRKTSGREIASSPTHMENELVGVEVAGDGTVTLTDKTTGQHYGPLNYFEDTGDVGDYWIYYPPYSNKTFTSKDGSAEVWLEENTELQASICARVTMMVPKYTERPRNYVRGKSERSELLVPLEFLVRYTLKKGEPYLRVKTTLQNTASDHKVTALFDTGIHAKAADAQGHFCVDRRDALPLADENGRYFNEMTPQPMQDFVHTAEEDRDFSVVTNSLADYDISQPGRLRCTLVRSMQNICCTEFRSFTEYHSQHGGQSHGEIIYDYALWPGEWNLNKIALCARRFNVPLQSFQFTPGSALKGQLPAEQSFYSVEGAVVSAFKKAESGEGYILRVYHTGEQPSQARISLMQPIREAYITDMAETRQSSLEPAGGALELTIAPDKIVTLQLLV